MIRAAGPWLAAARRRAAAVAALAAIWLLTAAAPAAACSVCFGTRDNGSPLVTGARLGVFFLLAVTAAVLGGIAKFFFYLRQRARQAEADGIAAEWAHIQRSTTSC
ncbi:MAG: hypothetical protein NDJ75_00400 [Thermoanaerobaculia bacterium]|nr:hypothetical protein [Thermoanaerobaculia bacterium]